MKDVRTQTAEERLLEVLPKALGEQYENFRLAPLAEHDRGTTRIGFLADWKLPKGKGVETRFINVDIEPPQERPRSVRHVERGYDTGHEAGVLLGIKNKAANNIIEMYDCRDLSAFGWNGVAVITEYFESESLETKIQQGLLNKKGEKVFSQILRAAQHYSAHGLLHRDLKPSNIRVNENLEVRVTDFANARDPADSPLRYAPTAGGHVVTDPLLHGSLTGTERKYTMQSEIYALASTLLRMKTGSYATEYNDEPAFGVRVDTGESILTDGELDPAKHAAAISDATRLLPARQRRLLRRGLTINEDERFASLNDFVAEYYAATGPGVVRKNKGKILSSALIALSLIGGGVWLQNTYPDTQAIVQAVEESRQTRFNPQFREGNQEIGNDLVDLEVDISNISFSEQPQIPRTMIYAGHEDIISVNMRLTKDANELISGQWLPKFQGRVYIEGVPDEIIFSESMRSHGKFDIEAAPFDTSSYNDLPLAMRQGYRDSMVINIPDVLTDGVYILTAELYSFDKKEYEKYFRQASEYPANRAVVDAPEKPIIIDRETFPILIGNPHAVLDSSKINLTWDENISAYPNEMRYDVRNFGEHEEEVIYRATLADTLLFEQRGESGGATSLKFKLEEHKRGGTYPLMLAADKEGIIWSRFLPLQTITREWDGDPSRAPSHMRYEWKVTIPGPEYCDKMVAARESYERRYHE